jgi:hypothetical protein
MILPENPIPEKVAQYRKLKGQIDALKAKQDALKAELYPLVEAQLGRKWTDSQGWARIVTRRESISYNNKALEALYESVPEIASAIGPHRKVKPGSAYLQIK